MTVAIYGRSIEPEFSPSPAPVWGRGGRRGGGGGGEKKFAVLGGKKLR